MTPHQQLNGFIDKFTPEVAAQALLDAAAASVALPINPVAEGRLTIKLISAKQLALRP